MTKNEFLTILRGQLTGKLSQADVESNINYYSNYINEEMMGGKTEEAVIDELGNPRMIAKNLVAAAERIAGNGGIPNNTTYTYDEQGQESEESGPTYGQTSSGGGSAVGRVIGSIVTIIIAVLVIFFLFRMGFFMIRLLIPIIAILVIGGRFLAFFRRR